MISAPNNNIHIKVNAHKQGEQDLYLYIGDNHINAILFSHKSNKVYDIYSKDFDISDGEQLVMEFEKFVTEFKLNNRNFSHVSVQILTNNFSIFPESFIKGESKELLDFTLENNTNKIAYSNLQEKLNQSMLFAYRIPQDLKDSISKLFRSAVYTHSGCTSISLLLNHTQFKKYDMYLNYVGKSIEITIKKKNNLLFYNVFPVNNDEDVLYFTLYSMEQNKLNPAETKIVIAANINVQSNVFKELKKYIRNISFAKSTVIDKPIENLPNHFYFNTLNRKSCE